MMVGSRQVLLTLGFVATLLSACSSVAPEVQPPPAPEPEVADPYLSVSECLDLGIQAPSSVSQGEGLSATLTLTNTCGQAFGLPLSDATAVKNGEDSGVELNFQILVTELFDPSGGATVLWSSTDPNPAYVKTQSVIVLEPGESIERELSWSGQLEDGETVPADAYILQASFAYVPNVTNNIEDAYTVWSQQPFEIVEP